MMMICLPIVEDSKNKAIEVAKEYLKYADIVEFRVDYFKEVSINDIKDLCQYPSIITIRIKEEGGFFEGDREELFKEAIKNNAKFIDVELREKLSRDLVEYRNKIKSETKIIVSYHNFKETPRY